MYNVHPKWSRKIDLDFCAEFVLSWQACDQPAVVMMWLLDLERRATLDLLVSCLLCMGWCGCWTWRGGPPWSSPSPASLSSYSSFPHLLDFHLEDLRCKDGTTSTSLILFLESWNLSHSILGILKGISMLKIGRMAWQSCINSISSFFL